MSLPDVEWRYVGFRSIGTGTITPDVVLDNIYTLATSSSYIDGSPRAQGSGSAGTWGRYQTGASITEALYMVPPSGDQAIVIAGSSGASFPDFDTCPEAGGYSTYYANKLYVNVIKNPGATFNVWDSGNPYVTGSTTGYVPFLGSRTTVNTGITSYNGTLKSYLFESKESIAVFLIETTTTSVTSYTNGFFAGALIDPLSTSPYDAESDGRLYGIFSTGHFGSTYPPDWAETTSPIFGLAWHDLSSDNTSFLYGYNATYCAGRAVIFEPGSSNVKPVVVGYGSLVVPGNNLSISAVLSSGKYIRMPLVVKGATASDSVAYGALRNIGLCKDGLIGQRHMDGSNTTGYIVSCSNNSAYSAQAVLLEY